MSIEQDSSGSYWLKVESSIAYAGEYIAEFTIEDLDEAGEPFEQTIQIQTILTDTDSLAQDDSSSNDESSTRSDSA